MWAGTELVELGLGKGWGVRSWSHKPRWAREGRASVMRTWSSPVCMSGHTDKNLCDFVLSVNPCVSLLMCARE
jgi:hypothetical protein